MRKLPGSLVVFLFIMIAGGCYYDIGNINNESAAADENQYISGIILKVKDGESLSSSQLAPLPMDTASIETLLKGRKAHSIRRLVPDTVIEGFRNRARRAGIISARMIEKRAESKKRLHLVQVDKLTLEQAKEICRELQNDPRVEYAEPDHSVYATETFPDDPNFMYGYQWSLFTLDMYDAWDHTTGSADVIVAVIDTGVDYTHPDLAGNCMAGYDYRNNDPDPMDDHFHGTHVAGIIGAMGNNGFGNAGIAWRVRIMPLKFMSLVPETDNNYQYGAASGSISSAISCINYAISNGADIINASYGSYTFNAAEREAILDARDAGILFVAAAGNGTGDDDPAGDNTDTMPHYPASYNVDNIISVASSTNVDTLASYSNYGAASVDLAAPGSGIYSTTPMTLTTSMDLADVAAQWASLGGTSMASPHVAGVAALIKSLRPEFSYADIKHCILHGVEENSYFSGKVLTDGRLNGHNSVLYASTYTRPAPSDIAFTLPPNGTYTTPWQWLGLGTKPLVLKFTVDSAYPVAAFSNAQYVSGNTYSVTLPTTYSINGVNTHELLVSFVDNRGYIKEFKVSYSVKISLGYLIYHYVYRNKITYTFIQ